MPNIPVTSPSRNPNRSVFSNHMPTPVTLTHPQVLEAEAIQIKREVGSEKLLMQLRG